MLSQDKEDEARLLGAVRRPSGALEIKPGAGRTKPNRPKPGASGAFRPADRISNSRQSGPVRASKKAKTPETYLNRHHQHLQDLQDFRDSSRPSKRRCHDVSGTGDASRKIRTAPGTVEPSASANHSFRTSPVSNFSLPGTRNNRQAPVVSEFRGVEATVGRSSQPYSRGRLSSIASFTDESFTLGAAAQRRSSVSALDFTDRNLALHHSNSPRLKRTTLGTIEMTDSDSVRHDQHSEHLPSSRKVQHTLDPDDSPDELQGEVTTQPPRRQLHQVDLIKDGLKELESTLVSPSRKRSPSDIEPTQFVSRLNKKSKKTRRDQTDSEKRTASLRYVRFGLIHKLVEDGRETSIDVCPDRIVFGASVTGGRPEEVLFRHVRAILHAAGSQKVRLQLRDYQNAPGNILDMQFSTTGDRDFVKNRVAQMQDRNTKCVEKSSEWLDNAFSIYNQDMRLRANCSRPIVEAHSQPQSLPSPVKPASKVKGKKLSSMLEGSASESDKQLQSSENVRSSGILKTTEQAVSNAPKLEQPPLERDVGVEISVKKFSPHITREPESQRETRTMTRRSRGLTASDPLATSDTSDLALQHDPFRKNWKKPLVYPKVGKKKEEVNVDDRDRLRENQLLNDNLIAFYIRFLQDHLDRTRPDVAKRVYFFNSYFFATLTNKGPREINYDAVEKWTRNVDLFSYDYIVVPINQSAHWYVAIICNLPRLVQDAAGSPEPSTSYHREKTPPQLPANDAEEIAESLEPEVMPAPSGPSDGEPEKTASTSPPSEKTMQSLDSITTKDRTKTISKEEPPTPVPGGVEAEPVSARKALGSGQERSTSKQPGKSKPKKRRGGVKLNPGQTAIITFDSLDAPRSPTVKLLREYICREAASKRRMEISNPNMEIKGMRAQNIPLQPNYSDCGLYLLAYLENFARNPDRFVTRVLQREMTVEEDWPPLASGLLRIRMRNFLDQLYEEQGADPKNGLLADQQPISFLLGTPKLDDNDSNNAPPKVQVAKPTAGSTHETETRETSDKDRGLAQTEPADDDTAFDLPVLVPMAPVSAPKRTENSKPSTVSPGQRGVTHDSVDIQEIPDSQEMAASTIRERNSDRGENQRLKSDKTKTSRSGGHESKPGISRDHKPSGKTGKDNPPAQLPQVEVQVQPAVQVPRTPPPKEPKKLESRVKDSVRVD
ncbi:hypothetical protein POX_a00525 [Penicillium oxalicum]|uniref:hypothetical protein n=1 Tax=Penicillium oxalicum TaxID=69781 RepID=UPI0020B70B60|nr:hypothetical protein POX_a00525 [Penicillium oxalicum]KAI2793937.1 hypothetical protein POX_a00525 [Penicillium oxalicum]